MTFLETSLAIVVAQIPTYFIQRYFFKKVLDNNLDKFENKIMRRITKNENQN